MMINAISSALQLVLQTIGLGLPIPDESDTDPDDQETLGDNDIPNDSTSDTEEGDGLQQHVLPVKEDILHAPLSSYYYTDGSGPSVPEPDKKWHVKQ